MLEELVEKIKSIKDEFFELLNKYHPEYKTLYEKRFEYALGQYPDAMRIHNCYEILRTYVALKDLEKK